MWDVHAVHRGSYPLGLRTMRLRDRPPTEDASNAGKISVAHTSHPTRRKLSSTCSASRFESTIPDHRLDKKISAALPCSFPHERSCSLTLSFNHSRLLWSNKRRSSFCGGGCLSSDPCVFGCLRITGMLVCFKGWLNCDALYDFAS